MNIKKLIVLCGKPNTGKTQSLLDLVKKLTIVRILKRPRTIKGRDFIGIYRIKNYNVGIVFAGDSKKQILEGLNALKKSGIRIDIVICTCHPLKIVDVIKLYGTLSSIVVAKTKANNVDNNNCVKEILLNI